MKEGNGNKKFGLDQETRELIKKTICDPKCTPEEVASFCLQVERTGLDPFAKQIYPIMRYNSRFKKEVMTTLVSIDGFRLVAERSGKYTGQLGPYWRGSGKEWDDVWLQSQPPIAAKVGILRRDFTEPCWGTARFEAYMQKDKAGAPAALWRTMPEVMIAKVAESVALRRAFPMELSGLHSTEEMDHVPEVGSGFHPDDYEQSRKEAADSLKSELENAFPKNQASQESLERIDEAFQQGQPEAPQTIDPVEDMKPEPNGGHAALREKWIRWGTGIVQDIEQIGLASEFEQYCQNQALDLEDCRAAMPDVWERVSKKLDRRREELAA